MKKLEKNLEELKRLKKREEDLYMQRSGLSSAYAGASNREQDSFDRLYDILDEKIKENREEIEKVKAQI